MSCETTIAPWISVNNATEAIQYYQTAFNAITKYRLDDGSGKPVVAQLSIDGACFWLQEDPESSPNSGEQGSVRMILTVEDPDVVFEQALASGASVISAINEDHGWRIGRVADPFGHHWEIGKQLE